MKLLPRIPATPTATWIASAASIAVLLVTLAILGWNSREAADRATEFQLRDSAKSLAAHLQRVTEVAHLLLFYQQDLARATDRRDPAAVADTNLRLQRLIETAPYLFRLFMVDEQGDVYASSMKQWGPLNAQTREYFQFHRSGGHGLHISSVLRSQATGEPIIIFSRRISGQNGAFRGIVIVSFQLEDLRAFAQGLLPEGWLANFQVIGPNTQIIVDGTPPPDQTGALVQPATQERLLASRSGTWTYTASDDVERLWAHERVGSHPIWIRVGIATGEMLTRWLREAVPYAVIALFAIALLLWLFVVGVRQAGAAEAARRELHAANRGLERRVQERTSELEASNKALTDSVETLETLQAATTRLASELQLKDIVQAATDAGVALTGADFGAFFYNVTDESGESYLLYTLSGVPPEKFANFPMPRNTAVFGPTFRGEVVRSDDVTRDPRYGKNKPHNGMPAGHLPVRSYLAVPVISRSGDVLGGLFFGHPEPAMFTERVEQLARATAAQAAIAIDNARLFESAEREIGERKETENRLRLLAREVDHRAKNMLAVVQSMVQLTRSGSVQELKELLNGRIAALGRAHSLLAESRWQGAGLRPLVAEELAPYEAEEDRATIAGPDVVLSPPAAQNMAMVIHELATNAAKYGAFSLPDGRVAVDWRLDGGQELTFRWSETGGPPVARPEQHGFGLRLISRSISYQLDGDVALDWKPDGLLCTVRIPMEAAPGEHEAGREERFVSLVE